MNKSALISNAENYRHIPRIRNLLNSYEKQVEKKAPVNKILKKLAHEMSMVKNKVEDILNDKAK